MTQRLLVATGNPGKMREYGVLLEGLPFELVSLRDVGITQEVDETGETFEENAWLKASEYAALSGLLTLADDSGLEVDALGGAPGVRSARYGGDACQSDSDRVELLLKNMEDVPWEERTARFRCVIMVAAPGKSPSRPPLSNEEADPPLSQRGVSGDFAPQSDSSPEPTLAIQSEGKVAGMIQYEAQGDDGFGYDPVFYVPSHDRTFAQLPMEEKNKLSHRARATEKALPLLKALSADS